MEIMLWVWIGVIALAMIVEALSMDMTSIWFAVGGIFALIFWGCKLDIVWQILIFLIVSILCIVFLRKITKKLIQKPTVATNIDKLIGTSTKLIDAITAEELGTIKINGIFYTAKSIDDSAIESGKVVEIVQIEGNKMIVKPILENEKEETKENKEEVQVENKEIESNNETKVEDNN